MSASSFVAGAIARSLTSLFRPRPVPPGFTPTRILVIKLCCLGDVLMATPALAAVRRAFPTSQLDFAVGSWSQPAIRNNANVSGIVDTGDLGGGHYPLGRYWSLARAIGAQRYDLAIVLERSVFATMLPLVAGIPYRVGLDSEGRGFPLTTRVPCVPLRHEAALYLDVAQASFGHKTDSPTAPMEPASRDGRPEFYPSADESEAARRVIAGVRRPIVAIHPGGAVNPGTTLLAKRWNPERFASVADRLVQSYGATVLLAGGPSDSGAVHSVQRAMNQPCVLLSDKLTFGELGAIFAECDLFVGNDSGPAHLAAAAGAQVVVVFGPTDPRVYGPYGGAGEAVWAGAHCAPCFTRGQFPLCSDHRCIQGVTVEMVWKAVERQMTLMLERRR